MKHLLLTTAIIAAGATGAAYAETAASGTDQMAPSTTSAFMTEAAEGQIRASDFIGMRVYAAADTGEMTDADGAGDNWEDIGEINDVVMSRDGQIEAVLVDIGGFLGIGERQVAVNLDQVRFVSDSSTDDAEDFFLVLNADPATLDEAPAFGNTDAAAMDDAAATDTTDTAAVETDAEVEDAGDTMADAADTAETEMEEAGNDVADAADATGEAIEDGAENVADAAADTGAAIENGAEEMAADADAALDNDAEVTAEAEATASEDEMTADAEATTETPMAGSSDMAAADAGMAGTPVDDGYLTAENLDGARVYDSNDKWVGEISELVIAEDGQITDAIVDVGGFLGIGEKPVALKLTDLQILRQDGSEEVRIYTAMAEEDLKAMPEFEKQ